MTTAFRAKIREQIANSTLQAALDANAERRANGQRTALASLPDWQERRQRAHAVRAEVVANLEHYLEEFSANAQAFARDNSIRLLQGAELAKLLGRSVCK